MLGKILWEIPGKADQMMNNSEQVNNITKSSNNGDMGEEAEKQLGFLLQIIDNLALYSCFNDVSFNGKFAYPFAKNNTSFRNQE